MNQVGVALKPDLPLDEVNVDAESSMISKRIYWGSAVGTLKPYVCGCGDCFTNQIGSQPISRMQSIHGSDV